MLETPHVLVGVAIASKVPNPLIAYPMIFASHFILDMVPHWNPHLNTEVKKYGKVTNKSKYIVVADVLLSLGLGFAIASNYLPDYQYAAHILVGGFMGVLPDVVEGPYFFLGWKTKLVEKWIKFQKSLQNDTSPLPGLLTQVATLLASMWWIFN